VSSVFGYARVSTADQNLSLQQAALAAAGCAIIRAEKASGASLSGRTELETLMEFLRPGGKLVVTRIDRLARSLRDLQNIVHELRERGVHLRATEQPIEPPPRPARRSWTCCACSPSSRPTCGASGSW
jgi:DNA invertase Pin-like site-specific DNA recombinase